MIRLWCTQVLAIIRLEMKKTFFARRGLWVYLLAFAPLLLFVSHSIATGHHRDQLEPVYGGLNLAILLDQVTLLEFQQRGQRRKLCFLKCFFDLSPEMPESLRWITPIGRIRRQGLARFFVPPEHADAGLCKKIGFATVVLTRKAGHGQITTEVVFLPCAFLSSSGMTPCPTNSPSKDSGTRRWIVRF